jgi:plasmid stabilization system protein ParE
MRQLVYSRRAREDLADIYIDVRNSTGQREIASKLIDRLTARCRILAQREGALNRLWTIFGRDLRSQTVGNYVIFFRTTRYRFTIVAVLQRYHGARP